MSEMHQISDTVFQSKLSSIYFYCQIKDQDSSFLTFLGIEIGKAEDKLTFLIKNQNYLCKLLKEVGFQFTVH